MASTVCRAARNRVTFGVKWLGLELFGPAQLDNAHDPIEGLRRRYGLRPRRSRTPHPSQGARNLQQLDATPSSTRGRLVPDATSPTMSTAAPARHPRRTGRRSHWRRHPHDR